ncbi:MAG TPA: hypothetical protein H9765_12605 [Candidatus Mediterraneibacter intestinigallinarum]|nr:hypothetical protein [Candidatus Mediterraneibacter intestinigallinarum]
MIENEAIKDLMFLKEKLYNGIFQDRLNCIDLAIAALEEVQKYRQIGTVEECREAVEKQKAKKIVYESNSVFSDGFTHYRMGKCSMCDRRYNSNDDVNYCSKCGQAIRWEESEEE